MKKKIKLEDFLIQAGIAETRKDAQALIRLGRVTVNGELMDKPGTLIPANSKIEIKPEMKYVSRGGLKLESALMEFKISPEGKICLDIGASTGGFSDCLLQNNAKKVYALDVGKGLLNQKLRNDPRIIPIENFNARYISPEVISEKIQLATIDVSFISLKLILPPLKTILAKNAIVLPLVKPQFELKPKFLKKGVVREPELQMKAVDEISSFAEGYGFKVIGRARASIKGPKGNQEYFLYLVLNS